MDKLISDISDYVNNDWLKEVIIAVVILLVTAFVSRLATKLLRRILKVGNEKNLPASSIFVNIGRAAVWVLGVCIMLSSCFKVDVSAAIAALGVGGIALSLGLQDTISNLMGGLQVSLLRIVKPGDHITVSAATGIVRDVTWRHTTIRTITGEEVVIPNSIINKNSLTQLPPLSLITVPLVVVTDGENLDAQSKRIVEVAKETVTSMGTVKKEPYLIYTAVTEDGFKGVLKFMMADSRNTLQIADAVIRAIAPFTRQQTSQQESDSL